MAITYSIRYTGAYPTETGTPYQVPRPFRLSCHEPFQFTHRRPLSEVDADHLSGPCTVVHVDKKKDKILITPQFLTDRFAEFARDDDVWDYGFLETVLFTNLPQPLSLDGPCITLLISLGVKMFGRWKPICHKGDPNTLQQGPYWISGQDLWPILRLYPDRFDAFVRSTIQSESTRDYPISNDNSKFSKQCPTSLSIAVPSRLSFPPSDKRPLAGLRIAVQDNTDIIGQRTGASSRSFTKLYAPVAETAPAVQKLIDLGAIVVGKTKTTQFGDPDPSTSNWVDVHPPFTPRADGYQSPGASSAGSGAAMAAYDWLDFATGTDNYGGLRAPAASEGLFTMRPSYGLVSMKGIIPWGVVSDTFGVFARGTRTLNLVSRLLYKSFPNSNRDSLPTKILYPSEYWQNQHTESKVIFESFISKLEAHLHVKRTVISIEELWQTTDHANNLIHIQTYLHDTLPDACAPVQTKVYKEIQKDYIQQFGRAPYFNPQDQYKLEWLPTVTAQKHKDAITQLAVFRRWFEKEIIPPSTDGSSGTLLLLPWSTGKPSYRDEHHDKPNRTGQGWEHWMISIFAQAPEMIVPIGQTSFFSKVTKKEEWLPVSIGIIGARHSDPSLIGVVHDVIRFSGMEREVQTGETAFEVGSVLEDRQELNNSTAIF